MTPQIIKCSFRNRFVCVFEAGKLYAKMVFGAGQGLYMGTDLVQTLASQVPQGLLQAEGQRLTRPLHVHDEGNAKHVLVLVVWYLHPLHELWYGPARKRPNPHN